MCGSGATTGKKKMGVKPIFFWQFRLGISGSASLSVRRLGARPAGESRGGVREHL
jgi:hypothetical protein